MSIHLQCQVSTALHCVRPEVVSATKHMNSVDTVSRERQSIVHPPVSQRVYSGERNGLRVPLLELLSVLQVAVSGKTPHFCNMLLSSPDVMSWL